MGLGRPKVYGTEDIAQIQLTWMWQRTAKQATMDDV